jgi:hypothetical protein
MADRLTVACPAGHKISTTLRGRSTTCGQCGRRVYVRADGTTAHKLSRSVDGQAAPGNPRKGTRPAAGPQPGRKKDALEWDPRREIERPLDLIDGVEYNQPTDRTRFFDVDDNLIGWAAGNYEATDGWPDDW